MIQYPAYISIESGNHTCKCCMGLLLLTVGANDPTARKWFFWHQEALTRAVLIGSHGL